MSRGAERLVPLPSPVKRHSPDLLRWPGRRDKRHTGVTTSQCHIIVSNIPRARN